MGRIKDQNYYQISGWMINQLGLSGRELHAYAIIYGFTQDGETEFNGSLTYIAEWLGSTRQTAINVLKALVDKGLLEKTQIETPDGKRNYYTTILPNLNESNGVVKKLDQGSQKITPGVVKKFDQGGSQKIRPNNNTFNNNINNNIDNLLCETAEKSDPVPYEKIKKLYNEICKSFSKVVTVSPNRKKAIAARWKEYGGDLATFETMFNMAEASDFLKGKNDRNWTATFDWLLKADNMAKVLEGNYRNKGDKENANAAGTSRTKPGAGTDKPAPGGNVRAITTAELEDKLRKSGQFKGYPDFNAMFGGKTAGTAEQSAGGN